MKKKKGRPSLLDLHKRSLKLYSQNTPLFNNNNITINSNILNNNHITINSNEQNCELDQRSAANHHHLQVENRGVTVVKKAENEKGGDGGSTPLPDKKLLLFIVDSLQKKDTYGVFANPVDPEELPDYHDIVKSPMDYSTLRKKLEDGAYDSLEQFEKDIFLICSNAMLYNGPDSIYFRQARSMQELARKNFDNLRQDSGEENETDPEPKIVRRGRPPTKHLKRPRGRPPLERPMSKFSEANHATVGEPTNRLNEHKKPPSHLEMYGSNGSVAKPLSGSRKNETRVQAERFERPDDVIGSASKGYSVKQWKKQIVVDENRRNTYKNFNASACGREPSVLNTFKGERKQLIAVGLHTKYGYARSLSRFAAKFGPVAWKVASKKIEKCLPSGVKYGHGWVGENGDPSKRPKQQLLHGSDQSTAAMPPQSTEQTPQVKQSSETHTPTQSRINGMNCSYAPNFTDQMGKIIEAENHPSVATSSNPDDSREKEAKTGHEQKAGSSPPDLNVGFHSPGSSGSMQPDLALQL